MCAGMVKKNATANATNEEMLTKDERKDLVAFGISIVLGIVACVVASLAHGVGLASMGWGGICLFDAGAIAYVVYGIIGTVKGDNSTGIGVFGKVLLGAMVMGAVITMAVAFACGMP